MFVLRKTQLSSIKNVTHFFFYLVHKWFGEILQTNLNFLLTSSYDIVSSSLECELIVFTKLLFKRLALQIMQYRINIGLLFFSILILPKVWTGFHTLLNMLLLESQRYSVKCAIYFLQCRFFNCVSDYYCMVIQLKTLKKIKRIVTNFQDSPA